MHVIQAKKYCYYTNYKQLSITRKLELNVLKYRLSKIDRKTSTKKIIMELFYRSFFNNRQFFFFI